jgi:hypothetical protein
MFLITDNLVLIFPGRTWSRSSNSCREEEKSPETGASLDQREASRSHVSYKDTTL